MKWTKKKLVIAPELELEIQGIIGENDQLGVRV
jgi:hypothetical protein